MKIRKNRLTKTCMALILMISAFLIVPQFSGTVYATDMGESSWKITHSGNYYFTGSTTKNNIAVTTTEPVTITLENVTINLEAGRAYPAIDIQDNARVTIKLTGTNYLHGGKHDGIGKDDGYAGIRVSNSAELTILGNGSLEAVGWQGQRGAAGIGGDYGTSCGKITIGNGSDNPTVVAKGGGVNSGDDGAAGIGGGYDGQANNGIIINSGNVTAKGGNGAAGIGGGQAYAAGSGGKVTGITINGGTVTATGGTDAAGIGGGESGSSGDGGNVDGITITGGTINATGGENGAGIGGSKDAMAYNINISGGTINATGGKWAAGIGAGNSVGAGDGGTVEGLTITGGNITATAGYGGAGIGGSDGGNVYKLKIDQASGKELTIKATGGDYGAGIGNSNTGAAGNAGVIQNDIGNITIKLNGGSITATGGYGGAGIGGGNSKADKIEIYGSGSITAKGGDHSCAIGAGLEEDGGDIIIKGTDGGRNLKIDARNIENSDTAVIGGADSKGGNIEISNADIRLYSPWECRGAAIGSGANASMISEGMGDITITNCFVKDESAVDRNAASIGAGFSSLVDNITIKDSEIEGGTIGGTDNGNKVFSDPTIQSITITGSTVTAVNDEGQRAGIGSGRFSGIKQITITDSTVTASTVSGAGIGSGGYSSADADFAKWTGNACGDITITRSTVTATGDDGGAGIGGGWGTPVGKVTITDCPSVKATGGDRDGSKGGAGIGGGWGESAGDITISNSNVEAAGAGDSAGIGSSGAQSTTSTMWNTTCNSVHIKNNSNVTATGGYGGAGIGTGYGAQYGAYAGITINDSTVTAQGGEYAAGIGAGCNGSLGSGGESTYVDIIGKCKVTASGGVGGAGIGGGRDGGSDPVSIKLAETAREGDDWKYYVKAYGGKGAAGIGSGGVYVEAGELATVGKEGKDIKSVSISGGYVYAQGGDDDNGAGAGIGGGARGGNIDKFFVSGGFVEAHSGAGSQEAAADDIGTGGDDERSATDDNFQITGGTVLAGLSSDPVIVIDGGTVRHKAGNVARSDGTKVYQTTMKVEDKYIEPSGFAVTSYEEYGKNDIFSDENGRIYLYLPESETEATAEYNSNGTIKKYHGNTYDDNSGWLKMDGVLSFKETEEHIVNEEFVLELDDADIKGEVSFALEQNSPSEKCIDIVEQNNTSPGAWIKLKAADRVTYTVTAIAYGGYIDSEMYWRAEGSFSESVTKQKDEVSEIEDLSKVYDGVPVEDPAVTLESGRTDAVISYKYYDADGKYLGDGVKPVNAGQYSVEVIVEGNQYFTGVESRQAFEISKREIMLAAEPSSSGSSAKVRIFAMNAVDYPGSVKIKINNGTVVEKDFVEDSGLWVATADFEEVPGDVEYKIVSEYNGSGNYLGDTDELVCRKDKIDRELTVDSLAVVYGEDSGVLNTQLSADNDSSKNQYTFEIISDFSNEYIRVERAEPTITLIQENDSAVVQYNNVGYVVVKVTVSHPSYNDVIAYSAVTVDKKTLKVTSYAYEGNDTSDRVTELTYGSITDNVNYGLEYDGFIEGENPENAFESGSLAAVPLAETTQAGDHSISIIKKNGTPVVIGQSIKRIPFYSRNYELDLQPGTVTVSPATLYIDINDATGQYGMTEPEYSAEFGDADGNYGLMSWDSEENIIQAIGPEKDFYEYKPGVYENEITADISSENYKFEDADGKSTLHKGTLTVEKGNLSVDISVPSYVYNGNAAEAVITAEPVAAAGIDPENLAAPGEYELIFYEQTENGETVKLDGAPKDTGEYIAEVILEEDDYYNKASAEEHFQILKAHCDVETPLVPDMYISEGLKLSDQPLPEGWAWVDGSKELTVGSVREEAIYTPEDTKNYYTETAMVSFSVLKNEAEITITEDPSKVYDGKAVDDPDVRVISDASDVKYNYYDVTNDTDLGSSAPVNAGNYTVTAYVEETDMYGSAQSETVSFVIDKRDVALKIMAEEDVAGDSARVEMTVEVIVPESIALDEGSEIMLDVKEASGEYSETVSAEVENIGGRNIALFEFSRAAASHYEVKATFAETANFKKTETTQTFDKSPGERTLDVTIEHEEYMCEDTITVPYGTEPEIMTAVPSVKAPYGDSHEDEYSFRVVSESADDTVSLEETGDADKRKVIFENAGTAIIEVKVTNEAFYSDAVAYVTVIVEPCKAEITSYAYVEGSGVEIPTDRVQYGQVNTLKYGLRYEDDMGGDGRDILSVLETVAVNETAGVNAEGWPIKIIKSGNAATQKNILRNYMFDVNEGRVYVTPAPMILIADDITSQYGQEPEFTFSAEGLMSWDSKSSVAESVGIEKDYAELVPGKYDIQVSAKDNPNYVITTKSGVLTVEKGTVEVTVDADSKIYDGKSQYEPEVTLEPVTSEGISADMLKAPEKAELTYYSLDGEGNRTELSGAPVNAGKYAVKAESAENRFYKAAFAEDEFTIDKRNVSLAVTAEETGEISGKITVEVLGTPYIDESENAQITLNVRNEGGTYSRISTEKVKNENGKYITEFEFTKASAGNYDVKATFAETINHNSAEKEQHFDKNPGERSVVVETEHPEYMDGDTITVTYGTDPEMITAVPSVKGPYNGSEGDEYFFEVVSESAENTVTLTETDADDKRNIVFENAGTALIEVTVTNKNFYSDAVTYLTVIVEPCEAAVNSYAYKADDESKSPVTSVQYGQIDTLAYGFIYKDEVGSDGNEVLAALEAVPLDHKAYVKEGGWPVSIEKEDNADVWKGLDRNYLISYTEGNVNVTTAPLRIKADDIASVYGTEPVTYTYSIEGLMTWDNKTDIVKSVALQEGTEYTELKPDVYEDIIKVTAASNPNYNITTDAGTLSVDKADVKLTADIESKVYNGKAVETEIKVEPTVTADYGKLEKTEAPEVVYYEVMSDGTYTELAAAPVDAGKYTAEIIVPENEYYNSVKTEIKFRILKARYDVDTPEVEDIYIKQELKLSDQKLPEGWTWINGEQTLSVGTAAEYAVYTPEDTRNYYRTVRLIEFDVLINPAEISIVEDLSKVYDGTAVKDPAVVKTTDAETVTYTYHDVTNDKAMGSTAPVKAGKYTVTASVAETGLYTAAESAPVTFVIEKRDVVLAMTAEENIDGDIAKAKITVEVLGTDGVALDEGSEITLDVSEASGEYSRVSTEAVKLVDGRYIAEFSFTRAAANHYDVKAVFAETENFNAVETEQAFDKDAGERTVDVVPEHAEFMSGKTIRATYGTEPETVTAVPSVKHDGDEYSFEIVSDPLGKFAEPTISLSDADSEDKKQIVFENAGMAIIRVTVSNEAYYADAVTYVTVKVQPAELTVKADDVTVTYGDAEPAEYNYSVEGLVNGDTEDDIIVSAGLDGIAYADLKPGKHKDVIKVTTKDNRNYAVTNESGTLTMNKAEVHIEADIESKVYDGNPAEADIRVVPAVPEGFSAAEPAEYAITYYEVAENGALTAVDAAPVDAGFYKAVITVAETDYYNAAVQEAGFEITKATPDVETPEVPDMYIKEGLKLSDQELPEGWAWLEGSKALEVGHVSEKAEYTPEDTRNYNTVVRTVEFEVLINPTDPSDPTEPDNPTDPSNPDDPSDPIEPVKPDDDTDSDKDSDEASQTGDDSSMGTVIAVMLGALAAMICALAVRRKKNS